MIPPRCARRRRRCAQAIADVPGVDTAERGSRRRNAAGASLKLIAERAARYGLNIGDIEDVIETGLAGKAATEFWEGEKHFSIVVRLPEAATQPAPT